MYIPLQVHTYVCMYVCTYVGIFYEFSKHCGLVAIRREAYFLRYAPTYKQGDQIFAQWVIVCFGQLHENFISGPRLGPLYSTARCIHYFWQIMGWATFWANFWQSPLVTLPTYLVLAHGVDSGQTICQIIDSFDCLVGGGTAVTRQSCKNR
jgi:hypothetical protein